MTHLARGDVDGTEKVWLLDSEEEVEPAVLTEDGLGVCVVLVELLAALKQHHSLGHARLAHLVAQLLPRRLMQVHRDSQRLLAKLERALHGRPS